MKTPREIAEDVLAKEPWATALWDREAAIALVVEAVEESRRGVAAPTQEGTSFQVGDRVRLTGRSWHRTSLANDLVTIDKILPAVGNTPETPAFEVDELEYEIYRDDPEDFSATKVGD